ncbi:MAG: Rieske 2Fe-2S domain-containing protein [Pseudonocardiaceae bacterium]|nr:Rieske 2Fe-2S domain-containing protein [Pseudonocardiaceae bacterium]
MGLTGRFAVRCERVMSMTGTGDAVSGVADSETVEYVEVCAEDDLKDGDKVAVEIDGQRVLLARVDGSYYAIGAVCTHERAFLDEGAVVENVVYCPLHYSAFDLRTGCVLGPPADQATPTFGVKVSDGTVLVSVAPVEAAAREETPDDVHVEPVERSRTLHARLFDRIDAMAWLQRLSQGLTAVGGPVRTKLAPTGLIDLLHGRWLGHALHPALSDLPIGLWAGSVLLYLLGLSTAAVVLSIAGIATALAAMVTGIADLLVVDGHDRRVGLLHGLLMTVALVIQIGSPVAYFLGAVVVAVILAVASLAITVSAAYLGGHLVLARGAMVDHTVWPAGPREWRPTVKASELSEGSTVAAEVGGRNVLLYRAEDGRISAIEDACSHASGPLSLGKVCEGVVTCPWHDSQFRLRDGAVLRGPATFPQPVLEVRVSDGWIEVRPLTGQPDS